MENLNNKLINDYFCGHKIINENDLKNVLKSLMPNYDEKKYRFYFSKLFRKNIIYKYNNNILKPCYKRLKSKLEIYLSNDVKKSLESILPSITISIWNVSFLNNFDSVQIMKNINIVETYSYAKEPVLNKLLSLGKNVCYEKDYSIVNKYFVGEEIYIIKTINQDSPINKSYKKSSSNISYITTPKIEKIIVDLFCDKFIKSIVNNDLRLIYKELLSKFEVNFTTLLRYAKKKYCYDDLVKYLDNIGFNIEIGEFR